MNARSAHHSITGLHYQFDKSILTILETPENEAIILEGIEDIDLSAEYIQCKYHASQKYYRSSVRDPIALFLKHYAASNRDKTYTLYAHFKDLSGFKPIDLVELKEILGPSLSGITLSDAELQAFISSNFKFVNADNYNDQLIKVIDRISHHLNCDLSESSQFFYKNALHEVIRLARQPELENRAITRPDFLSIINKKRELYSVWLCQLAAQQDYVKHVKQMLGKANALSTTLNKFVYIDNVTISNMGRSNFCVLCESLLEKYFSVGSALKVALPLTIILDVSLDYVIQLKSVLLNKRIPVNDGYEHVSFQPWYFNRRPVINVGNAGGRNNDIIQLSSYNLRIITRNTYESHYEEIEPPDTFISTGTVRDCPQIHKNCFRHFHLHSPETDRVTLLLEVLAS